MNHYLGLGLQLVGFTMVGICLFSGLSKGDYGKLELIELVAGSILFYIGHYFRKK